MSFFTAVRDGIARFFGRSGSSATVMKLMTDEGDTGYFAFDGKLYHSDVVRSAVRPLASAVGKAVGKPEEKTISLPGTSGPSAG